MPRLSLALGVLAGLLLTAPAADAALPWAPCPAAAGFECARLDVPLDRSAALPGTVSLGLSRVPAASNPSRSAVMTLAGGPGQAAVPLSAEFADVLSSGLTNRDLVVFDQRGTGSSGALDCPALNNSGSTLSITRACAAELGPARGSYRTPDSVEDIEAIRVAGEYEKLVLFGVSYGTKVALQYAARHPDRVEALVLDSVVSPEGPDPFRLSSLIATTRIAGDVCGGGACAGATTDPTGDLARLTARLRRGALRGSVVGADGGRRTASLTQTGLFGIYLAGDLNPTLRAELPGATRAALRGDPTPILRLSVRSAGLQNGMQSASADSNALFLATTCEEAPFAWTRGASEGQRAQEITAAADRLPRDTLGPFSGRTALQGGVIPLCLGWPTASGPVEAPPALPAVPTLLLDGQLDVRTPLEDAQAVAARIPGAQVVGIPYTGHSVLGSDLSTCARQAVATFFAGGTASACAPSENPFSPTPQPASSLDQVKPLAVTGKPGRTLAAVRATIIDARRQIIGEAFALGRAPSRVGGLRGGTVSSSDGGYRLRVYEYVPRVAVTGLIRSSGAGTVSVRGSAAARGTLTIASSGAVRGRLGGRRIATSIAAGVRSADMPSLSRVLGLPDLR